MVSRTELFLDVNTQAASVKELHPTPPTTFHLFKSYLKNTIDDMGPC